MRQRGQPAADGIRFHLSFSGQHLQHVGQTACHYVLVVSDSLIHCVCCDFVHEPPASMLFVVWTPVLR